MILVSRTYAFCAFASKKPFKYLLEKNDIIKT
jgi:hypothetical protein